MAIIGIDLGTTNSAVAVTRPSGSEILENSEGSRTTPSIVAISKKGDRIVGVSARRQSVTNSKNTVYGIKRFMGHNFDDPKVKEDVSTSSFEVKKTSNNGIEVILDGKGYRPEEISAMILRKLKEDAEARLGQKVTEAVITVPAYFNDAQRKATVDAGKIAGLEVKRIINEPTAAALAYGFDKKEDEKIVVFDFGGGTFDVSVLQVSSNVVEVKATGGDSHLGGRDIDKKLLGYVIAEFKKESGIDLSKDNLAVQRLDEAVEKAKIELSQLSDTEINIPFITSTDSGPQHLLIKLNAAKLEELASPFIEKALSITKDVIKDSGISIKDIDNIILVGGQTRMPAIQKSVKELFGKELNRSINPDEVVAIGAAIQGGILSGDVKDILLLDVTPLSLGIETLGGVSTKLIEKNTTIPTSASQVFSTAADNQTTVEIHILQGERSMAKDNKSLGRFILDGIDGAPRGSSQIEVTFDLNTDGILKVKAVDKKSNKEKSIRIEAASSLSKEEIEKMQADAEKNAEEDETKKNVAEVQNILAQAIYEGEKLAKEESLSEEDKKEVEEALGKLKEVQGKEDVNELQSAISEASAVFAKHKQKVDSASGDTPEESPEENKESSSEENEESSPEENKESSPEEN